MKPPKLVSAAELARVREEMQARGEKLVLTNGCFDLLHAGHVRYLQQARALGQALAVALNGDDSVRQLKGPARPINPEADRAEVLAALACVDYVTIFPTVRVTEVIREVRPHLYVKGGDYTPESLDPEEVAALREAQAEVRILPLVQGRSTTAVWLKPGEMSASPLRLGVLGSGKGSNFRAIMKAIDRGELCAQVQVVLSDVENAGILALARERRLPAVFVPPGRFRTKLEPEVEERVAQILREHSVELVVLAGYMRMIKAPLLEAFPRRIVNIHPSLLPAFPGLEAWTQACAAGVSVTGCTVHYVDGGMDSGEIIAQATVPVAPDDTPASLHARIQVAEHALYPAALARWAESRRDCAE